jgi:hypothetical protein
MQLRPSDATNLAGKTDEELGRAHLSDSALNKFLACQRKWDLHYNERLEPIERPRALTLGSAFQYAIEHQSPEWGVRALRGEHPCAECGGRGQVESENGWLLDCGTCESRGFIPDAGALHIAEMSEKQLETLLINEAIVAGASKLYLSKWPGGPGETREFEYRVRLRSPWTGAYSRTFDLLGKADGVEDPMGFNVVGRQDPMLETRLPSLGLIENKLVGRIDDHKVQRLPLDRQIALARYGIWRATGRKVETVRYRWVRKPQIRQKQAETVAQYAERIRQDYEDRPDFYYHEEEPQFATTGDLLRIEAELWTWAEQMRAGAKQHLYPRNTSHCSDFGGCQFIPICTGDPDAMSLYRTRT